MFSEHELTDNNRLPKSVLAFGNFDGLHLGHQQIINKVKGINRVTYDISSKPPATIEWE